MLFSMYGPVLDVVALKTMSMRGQAHIVFRDVQASTQAMRSLDGQEFLGRNMVWATLQPHSTSLMLTPTSEDPICQGQVTLCGQA